MHRNFKTLNWNVSLLLMGLSDSRKTQHSANIACMKLINIWHAESQEPSSNGIESNGGTRMELSQGWSQGFDDSSEPVDKFQSQLGQQKPVIIVYNKVDLQSKSSKSVRLLSLWLYLNWVSLHLLVQFAIQGHQVWWLPFHKFAFFIDFQSMEKYLQSPFTHNNSIKWHIQILRFFFSAPIL